MYEAAAALGLRRVAHAGEEGPPAYITEALDVLGVERIDHGLRCMEDPALVARLVRDRVPLTLCPLSNVRLRAVDVLDDHPLPRDAGRRAAVHGQLRRPGLLRRLRRRQLRRGRTRRWGSSEERLRELARNSFVASFLDHDEERRARYLAEVEAYEFAEAAGRPAAGRPEPLLPRAWRRGRCHRDLHDRLLGRAHLGHRAGRGAGRSGDQGGGGAAPAADRAGQQRAAAGVQGHGGHRQR